MMASQHWIHMSQCCLSKPPTRGKIRLCQAISRVQSVRLRLSRKITISRDVPVAATELPLQWLQRLQRHRRTLIAARYAMRVRVQSTYSADNNNINRQFNS